MFASIAGRVNTLLLALLVLMAAAIIGILARRAGAGSLDPPGAPASTMHTLADTPPSWDQVLSATNGAPGPLNPPAGCNSDRFKCVMTYVQCSGLCVNVYPAVLDEETGLVWQRTPITTTWNALAAEATCAEANTGQRDGWRLPTLAELESLKDQGAGPQLPPGNPFSNPGSEVFWTSTEEPAQPTFWQVVRFDGVGPAVAGTGALENVWCVRGASSSR